jgi:hypothetical protein
MSSQFIVQTLFQQVVVESNIDFGRIPFTSVPGKFMFIQSIVVQQWLLLIIKILSFKWVLLGFSLLLYPKYIP